MGSIPCGAQVLKPLGFSPMCSQGKSGYISDIVSMNLLKVYSNVKILGEHHARSVESANIASSVRISVATDTAKQLAFRKKQIYVKYIANHMFDKRFDDLDDKEKNIVLTKFKHNIEMENQIRTNKCQHIHLYKSVMSKAHVRGPQFPTGDWQRLKDIVPIGKGDEVATCTICNLKALCPHYYAMFDELNIENLNNTLMKFASTHSDQKSHYCKICGDLLIKNIDDTLGRAVDGYGYKSIEFNPTEQKIWGNVSGIMSLYIKIKTATDMDNLIKVVSQIITPHVLAEEIRLLQIKTNSPQAVEMTLYIHIAIYTYAALIRLISFYPDLMAFNIPTYMKKSNVSKEGGDDSSKIGIKDLQRLFQVALSLILVSKKSTLSKVAGITDSAIKNMLIASYKKINNISMKRVVVSPEYSIEFIKDTHLFKYIKSKSPAKSDIELFGIKDEDELKSMVNPFANVSVVKGVVIPADNYFGYDQKIYNEYITANNSGLIEYLKNEQYKKSIDETVAYEDELQVKYNDFEIKLFAPKQMSNHIAREYYFRPYSEYKYIKPHPASNYCIDGTKHNFNIFIYSDKKQQHHEIHSRDITKWITDEAKNQQWQNFKLVDAKCSQCNLTHSAIKKTIYGKTSNTVGESITGIVNTNMDIESFYNYYVNRCLVKMIHNWVGNACEHCKITRNDIQTKNKAVYTKWTKKFESDIRSSELRNKTYSSRLRSSEPSVIHWITNYNLPPASYPPAESAITKLSKLIGAPTSQIAYIGFSHVASYSAIKSGKINPTANPTPRNISEAILRVRRYILAAIVEYRRIQNGANIKLWGEPKDIYNGYADITKTPVVAHSALRTPVVAKSYLPQNHTVAMHSQLVVILCSVLVELVDKSSKDYRDTTIKFITYLTGVVFWIEKYMSKPDRYKRSVVTSGLSLKTEQNAEGYVINEKNAELGEFDPFGMGDVDYNASEVFTDLPETN